MLFLTLKFEMRSPDEPDHEFQCLYSVRGFRPFRRSESYPLTDHPSSPVGYFG